MRARVAALWRQLAWFVGLWLAGVITLGAVSTVVRAWLQ
jgi:hypothetical protein